MAFDWGFLDNNLGNVGTPVAMEEEESEGGFLNSARRTVGVGVKGIGQFASDFLGVDHDNFISTYGQGLIEDNPTAIQELGDIAENPFTAISEAAGNAVPSIAGMVGARAIGTGITAAAPLTGPAAPIVATIGQVISWLGPAAIAAAPSYGSIRDKQIFNDPEAQDSAKEKVKALVGASTVGAIETKFGPQNWALALVTKEGRNQVAKKFAATSLGGRVLEAGVKGAASEGTEEIFQSPIEQYFSNDDPTSEESIKETIFGSAMGTIGGGILGAGFGAVNSSNQKEQAAKEDTPSTSWQDNLQAIREEQKKVLIERPEEILAKAGIDTSGDAKAPDIALQSTTPEVDTTTVAPVEETVAVLSRDIPVSAVEGDPQYLADQEIRRKIEAQRQIDEAFPLGTEEDFRDVSFTTNQEGTTLQRDIPITEPVRDAQYNTDREVKRKIEAQKEIDKNFPPESEKSEVSKLSNQIMQKQQEVNELQQVVKNTTNLKEKNVDTQKLNSAKSVLQDMKQRLQVERKAESVSPALTKKEVSDLAWSTPQQRVSSASTSISYPSPEIKAPIVFKAFRDKKIELGPVNADIGGGKYDQVSDWLKTKGVKNIVWDRFNRDEEHNNKAEDSLKGGKADTATVSNVLNVTPDRQNRSVVISTAHDSIKEDGSVFFSTYTASKSGNVKGRDAFQTGTKTREYVQEIEDIFGEGNVIVVGDIIIATKGKVNPPFNTKGIENEKRNETTAGAQGQDANETNARVNAKRDDGVRERKEQEGKEEVRQFEKPEERIAAKKGFLKKSYTADRALRFSEFADKHLGGSTSRSVVRDLTALIKSVGDTKLKSVKVKDTSEYPKLGSRHPFTMPKAFYTDGTIYINYGYFSTQKNSSQLEEALLHESVHALTVNEMESNKELKAKITKLLSAVRDQVLTAEELSLLEKKYQFNPVKITTDRVGFEKDFNRLSAEVYYGLLNEKEFLAQAFSSYNFQQELMKIKVRDGKGGYISLWKRFLNFVLSALNIAGISESALEEALLITSEIAISTPTGKGSESVSPALDMKEMTWEDMTRSMRTKPVSNSSIARQLKDITRTTLKSSSEVYRQLDAKVGTSILRVMRKFEQSIAEANVKDRDLIKDFMNKYLKMSPDDKNLLDLTLTNTEETYMTKRKELLKKHGMEDSYLKVQKVLDSIHRNREELGLNPYGSEVGYFPRVVKDYPGLLAAMAKNPDYNFIQAELRSLKNDEDREHAVRQMVNTGKIPAFALLKGRAGKKRTVNIVSSEWKHFYKSAPEALLDHIYESNELIASHRMFADSSARHKIVSRRNNLYKKIESEKLDEDQMKDVVAELEQIELQLKDPSRRFDKLDSILSSKADTISQEDATLILSTIRARLNQKGMNGIPAAMRNIALISALGSPISAVTQLSDLIVPVFKYGPTETIRAMFGPKLVTANDLDLAHSMKEFQTEGSAKWLDRTMTAVGIKHVDLFGKNVFMAAAINSARKLSVKEFSEKYGEILGDDTENTYNDIKANRNTNLVRFFAFNELSDWQPISLSEMPVAYQLAGNFRIFYALKSYNIKTLNNIYRESVYKIRTSESNTDRAKALANTGKLIILLAMAGATADELKEFILGKSADNFSDNFHENLLKMGFLSSYSLDKKSVKSTLGDLLIPPTGILQDPMDDIFKLAGGEEPDWKALRQVPIVGKMLYERFSSKANESDMSKLKQNIVKTYKSGSTDSDRIREYNKWARRNKKDLITTSSLLKAKRKKENV